MTSITRTETWRGPLVVAYPDGRRVAMEREAIIVTDIRDTPFGPMDCGNTRLMPWRYVELPRPSAKPWWRFW